MGAGGGQCRSQKGNVSRGQEVPEEGNRGRTKAGELGRDGVRVAELAQKRTPPGPLPPWTPSGTRPHVAATAR